MKTVILAGLDNYVFSAADLINPTKLKLVGFATSIQAAWNIYDEKGKLIEDMEKMEGLPVMPIESAAGFEPDAIILTTVNKEDEENLKYAIFRTGYQGEVLSLFDHFSKFSPTTAAIRKMVWRLEELGVCGQAGRGVMSFSLSQLSANYEADNWDTENGKKTPSPVSHT